MNQVMVRDMQPDDLPAVHAIEIVSFSSPWSWQSVAAEIASSQSVRLVAVIEDAVAGYVMARQVLDEGQLLDIAVHKDNRRAGIAGLLISELLLRLRQGGCKSLYLEVRESNAPAIKLYEKYGFRMISKRKDYYKNPVEGALIMKLGIEGNPG